MKFGAKEGMLVVLLVVASLAIKIPISLFYLHGFGIDESIYLSTARDYANIGSFGVDTANHDFRFVAPLLGFVMSGFYKVFGSMGPLMVSPIFGSLSIILFYYLGKIAIDKRAGKIAAVLAFCNPAFFLLNTRPLTETIGLFLFTATVLLIFMALKNGKFWLFVLPAALLSFLARYPYGVLAVIFLAAVLVIERKKKIFSYNILVGAVIAVALAAPWLLFNYDSYGSLIGGPVHQGSTDIGFDYATASWYVPYLFIIAGATFPFMLYGFVKDFRERKLVLFLVGIAVIFLVQFFVFGKSVQERYMLPALPFVTIVAVSGYMRLEKHRKNLAKYALVFMVALNLIAAAYLVWDFSNLPKYADAHDAAVWMKSNCGPVIMGNVFTPIYQVTGFDVIPTTVDPADTPKQEAEHVANDIETMSDKKIDCLVIDLNESPYKDSYADSLKNNLGIENQTFGSVLVYNFAK